MFSHTVHSVAGGRSGRADPATAVENLLICVRFGT